MIFFSNIFRFANAQYLQLLYVIPVLVVVFLIAAFYKKRAIKRLGNSRLLKYLMPDMSGARTVVKFAIMLLALTAVIFAIARPQFGSRLKEVKREGVEIIIALDVSNSMLAGDIKPNRLERAKMAISKLVEELRDDRIGLIVFAGDAYMQIPITADYSAIKLILPSINNNIVPKQGTAIGSAINMGMRSFDPESNRDKALIIITDGENHEDNPIEIAREAADKNITIHTIGMGTAQGSPVPEVNQYGRKVFRKDKQGNIVVSKLDEVTLQKIAMEGNGKYIRASNANLGLNTIFREISKMEKKEIKKKVYADYDDRFQYLAGLALILLLVEFMLLERKNKWLSKIDIFNSTLTDFFL